MLALLAEEYPKVEWDLQVHVGWLSLALLTLLGVWAWSRSESFRRAVFAREDPRLFALMRIVLGLFTIQCFWNLRPYWRMLWSDEGIFDLEVSRQRLARVELSGWTELDGFFDGWAVARFLWGKQSLFYFHGSPDFVTGYMVVFFVVLALYTVGFRSRVTGIVALLMMNGIYNRNGLYLEGTDTVFRTGWFLMIFAHVDGAWSVDNGLRRARERRLFAQDSPRFDWLHFVDRSLSWAWAGLFAGWFCLLTDLTLKWVLGVVAIGVLASALIGWVELQHRVARAAAGTLAEFEGKRRTPSGEPIRYRLIPAWPRYLLMAQLICIYASTGLYKTGDVWAAGDALYYSLNMDHFYRFEGFTQWFSALFATTLFRWMTWVTLWWEKLFGVVAIGIVLDWGLRHRDQAWYQAMDAVKWRKWLGRLALIAGYVVIWRIATVSYPWCIELKDGVAQDPGEGLATINRWMFAYIPAVIVAWFVLGRWPLKIPRPLAMRRAAAGVKPEPFVIDQEFLRICLFSRRLWLSLGLFFHGFLIIGMNIGMFPFIMLWVYFAFFTATPWLKLARWKLRLLRRWKATAWLAPAWFDDAFGEQPADQAKGVVETGRQTLDRSPSGPWWVDPWRLLVGPITLLRRRSRAALIEIDDAARERGGRIPDALALVMFAAIVSLAVMRGLEAQSPTERTVGNTTFVSDVRTYEGPDRNALKAEAKAREERITELGETAKLWGLSLLAFAAVAHFRRRDPLDRVAADPVLIGGPVIRTAVLGLMLWHSGAVASLFTPTYPITAAWRGEVRQVFGEWINGTNTSQSWKMFAPNPPRGNGFMRTIAIDQNGDEWILGGPLGDDHFENRSRVFFWNDRMRKMHRRMSGKSKWYLRYWAEFHCREWALEHDGELPREIQVVLVKTPIPKPDTLEKPSDPRKRKVSLKLLQTNSCLPGGDLTPTMKERRGIPLDEDDLAKVEAETRRREREAETKRRNWAARKDWGGDPEAYKAELAKQQAAQQGTPDDDQPDPGDEGG
ncbi:hypothetical protein ACNOYE_16535 [Nannocystaceae bacterium ST9]